MAVEDIRASISAEATNVMIGRKNKVADIVTSKLLVASEHPVRSLGKDGGANVCNKHLVDQLLDFEISLSLSLAFLLSLSLSFLV